MQRGRLSAADLEQQRFARSQRYEACVARLLGFGRGTVPSFRRHRREQLRLRPEAVLDHKLVVGT